MKTKALPWILALAACAGVALMYAFNQKQQAEIKLLQDQNQELQKTAEVAQEAQQNREQSENTELVQLRKDNEDVLRLRNEVRQLRDDKQQLTKQVQTAQSQISVAQAEALRAKSAQTAQASAAQDQQAQLDAFRQRYGLVAANATDQDKANACINNLRQIDGAKQQWALENKKDANAVPVVNDLLPYFKAGAMPGCPGGGSYTLNNVSMVPTCTIPGHVIPK
jgi:TolA-binding protein